MLVYHRTYDAAEILVRGFRDGPAVYFHDSERSGVWLSPVPLDALDGDKGNVVLAIDIPEAVLRNYERVLEFGEDLTEEGWVPSPAVEVQYEFLVPAAILNRYGRPKVHGHDYDGCTAETLFSRADDLENAGRKEVAARLRHVTIPFLEGQGLLGRSDPSRRSTIDMSRLPEAIALAHETVQILNTHRHSPFFRKILTETCKSGIVPVSDICSEAPENLATSLVGLAMVGLAAPRPRDPHYLAKYVVSAYQAVRNCRPALLAVGRVLTPPPNHANGSERLLVGLGLGLCHRITVTNQEHPTDRTMNRLWIAIHKSFDLPSEGVKADKRRQLMGDFINELFADLKGVEKYKGVPKSLLEILSRAALGLRNSRKQARKP
jgi:hypothetical protein